MYAPVLGNTQERRADYLAKQKAEDLLSVLTRLTGEWHSDIKMELERRGIKLPG